MRKSVKITLGVAGGITALFIGIGAAGGSSHATTVPAPVVTHSAPAAPASKAPATKTPAQPAQPAQPTTSVSQQQALSSAQGYLSDGQGFSRLGLISQLSSPSGDKFSVADATWAVDHTNTDWNAQAVISAKGYMSDGQGFSRSGLISQLDSPSGDNFTYAQASQAATAVGL